jgi:uncharacterized protein (TIGR00251 family)
VTGQATRIVLRVVPGAKKPGIVGRHGEGWKVRVSAPPEDGRANLAVCALLAKVLDLRSQAVTIVSGHSSRDKVVSVAGLSRDEIYRRLDGAPGKDPS